jgi:hypothetical protein
VELHQRDHDILAAAKDAAELVKASQGQPVEVVRAAEQRVAEVQQQVRVQVLEPRKRRRQLYSQVRPRFHDKYTCREQWKQAQQD